eukprot:Skav231609  [mRNA]  locus=scaffold1636:22758:23057:- [translate_table: standard]
MFFWYAPGHFMYVTPIEVSFPAHDSTEWASGIMSSTSKDIPISKLLSLDLESLEPKAAEFIRLFDLNATEVTKIIEEQHFLMYWDDAACTWLQQNPNVP